MAERSEILKKNKATRGVFTDGICRVSIRFDDGDRAQIPDISQHLIQGLPVSLAINFAGILNATQANLNSPTDKQSMTANDIVNMKVLAHRHGTSLNLVTHGNNDFNGVQDASPDLAANTLIAYQYGFNEFNPVIQDARAPWEIDWPGRVPRDPTTGLFIYDFSVLNGGQIRSFVVPGTSEDWIRSRSSLMRKAMQDVGLQFGGRIGTAMSGGAGLGGRTAVEGQAYGFNSAGIVSQMMDPDNAGTPNYSEGIKPGMITDPFLIPPGSITDLGQTVMTRNGFEGNKSDGYTNNDHIAWTLGDNNSGEDLGDGNLDWDLTFKYKYCRNLAMGMGWTHTCHGDVRSNGGVDVYGHTFPGVNINFNAGAATSVNAYSSAHSAWVYRKLQDANLIRVITVDEYNQHMYSDPAIGLDYIPNNMFIFSDVEIGDTEQGQSTTPAYVSARPLGATTWDSMNSFWDNPPADTGNQKWDSGTFQLDDVYQRDQEADEARNDAARFGTQYAGGAGVYAHPGSIKVRPNSADPTQTVWDKNIYSWIGLIPGRYKFSLLMAQPVSGQMVIDDVVVVGMRSRNDILAKIVDPDNNDGFKEYSAGGQNPQNFNLNPPTGLQTDLSFDFNLDPAPTATTSSGLDFNVPSIAAGADSGPIALDNPIVDMQPNSTVRLAPDVLNWDPTVHRIEATNTGVDAGAITLHNDDAVPWDPSSAGNYWINVEKTALGAGFANGSPVVPWAYSVTLRFTRNGSSEMTFSRPSLEYLGPSVA